MIYMNDISIKVIKAITPRAFNGYQSGKMYRIQNKEGWLEFILYVGDTYLSSYTGDVSPDSLPSLFKVRKNLQVFPTVEGWKLINKADSGIK